MSLTVREIYEDSHDRLEVRDIESAVDEANSDIDSYIEDQAELFPNGQPCPADDPVVVIDYTDLSADDFIKHVEDGDIEFPEDELGFTLAEFKAVEQFLDEARSEGFDDLIHEDYFVDYITEIIDDCYSLPKELQSGDWPYRHITVNYDAAAKEAKQDYTVVEIGSNTYYGR